MCGVLEKVRFPAAELEGRWMVRVVWPSRGEDEGILSGVDVWEDGRV